MILVIHSIHLTHNADANDDNNNKYFNDEGDYNNNDDDDDDNEDVDDKVGKDVGDRLHLNPDACPARRRAQLAAVALAIRVGGELIEQVLINFVF